MDAFVVVVEAMLWRSTEDWRLLRASGSVFTKVSFDVGVRYACIGRVVPMDCVTNERGWYDVVRPQTLTPFVSCIVLRGERGWYDVL